jgi:hypothetical protein
VRTVTYSAYRERVLHELRILESTARMHAHQAIENGENENGVSHEVLRAYADGLRDIPARQGCHRA